MKIVICSSIDFTPMIKECYEYLTAKGHEVHIPHYALKIINGEISFEEYLKTKEKEGDINLRKNSGQNLIRRHYELIKKSDAILVINLDKKNITGYIGGNTFLEMGFAHVLEKKIFLYNNIPKMSYTDEIKEMSLEVIDKDLSRIN